MNKRRNLLIVILAVILLLLIGITYAFFTYYKVGTDSNKMLAGEIYMKYNEKMDAINLVNSIPMTKKKALLRDDNYITFTIDGKNTNTKKDIYYEIFLSEGDEVVGRTRMNPSHIRLMLSEINGTKETVLIPEISYNDFNHKSVWVDTIPKNTNTTAIVRTYKLRMWIDDSVLISDTDSNADYTSGEYANSYASIKVGVYGDLNAKNADTLALRTVQKLNLTPNSVIDGCIPEGTDFNDISSSMDDLLCPYTDNLGITYYFRGIGSHNYVKWGGYYWRIVRINGDGSIRLIYQGETADAMGDATNINNKSYKYNSLHTDPTYVGYMYGKDFEEQVGQEVTFSDISATASYWFAKDKEFDPSTELYRLAGETNKGTLTENALLTNEDGSLMYPYTCRSTVASSTGTCQSMVKVNSYTSGNSVQAVYYTYSSKSLEGTRTDELASNAKTELDAWYKSHILNGVDSNNKPLTSYITDNTFCNDRSIVDPTYKSGFLTYQDTFYAGRTRLMDQSNEYPSLKCSDANNRFSTTTSYGNTKLTYPIALITADEMVMAGAKYDVINSSFYLYTNAYFWTMTPSYFNASYIYARVFNYTNKLSNHRVTNFLGLRPVINLDASVLVANGDGSKDRPYEFITAE